MIAARLIFVTETGCWTTSIGASSDCRNRGLSSIVRGIKMTLDVEPHSDRQDLAEGGGGQACCRSVSTREEHDAPWRICVRSAVRSASAAGLPTPAQAPAPA